MDGEFVKDQELKGFVYESEIPVRVEVDALGLMEQGYGEYASTENAPCDIDGEYRKELRPSPNPEHQK
jgi:hypothetical protein